MKKQLILIGGGGHAKSVIESINKLNEFDIVGILDVKEKVGSYISNIKVIGIDEDLEKYYSKGIKYAFITLGSIGESKLRKKLYENAKNIGFIFPNIIDKNSKIANRVLKGEGNFIGNGAIVNTDAKIGNNCIINTGSIIEHDCIIEDFVHISPGSTLSGSIKIGQNSHIGTNSTIIQGISVGKNTIVGAGSVLLKNLPDNVIAYGNPCNIIRNK